MAWMTPARRYQLKIENEQRAAQLLAAPSEPVLVAGAKDFNLLCDAIESEANALKDLPQGELRTGKKNELIARFLPFIETYLESGVIHANPILVYVMIWAIDVANISLFDRLARVCFEQGQTLPQSMTRTLQTFIADSILDWSSICRKTNVSPLPYFNDWFAMVVDWPIHDAIKSKYYKFAAEIEVDNAKALELYALCVKHDPKAQIKTAVSNRQKAIKAVNLTQPQNAEDSDD